MEDLPINGNSGQSYGFIHYRKVFKLIQLITLIEIQ